MNTRTLLAALAAGVAGFLLGWLLFDIILGSYYEANMIQYEGLQRSEEDFNVLGIFVANLVMGLLVAWVCAGRGSASFTSGLTTGAILGFLIYTSMDIFFHSMMNMFGSYTVLIVDILVNTVWLGAMGGVAGLVLGRKVNVTRTVPA